MAYEHTYNINNLKQTLGYGSRLNLYALKLTFPTALGALLGDIVPYEEELTILCSSVNFPATRTMDAISIPYYGDYLKLAGDKAAPTECTIIFRNKENLNLRSAFEIWTNIIQAERSGVRTDPATYKASAVGIFVLGRDKIAVKKANLIGAFPLTVSELALSEATAEVSQTTITLAYDSYEIVAPDA